MTFCAAFAFMECEKTENYTWVLEKLKGMMDPNALPSVIVTDRELALMNAITNVFPHATNLLYRWHIGKNVLAKCGKIFDDKMWEEFICSWGLVVLSASVAQYEERLSVLKRDFQMVPATLEYVEKNWVRPSSGRPSKTKEGSPGVTPRGLQAESELVSLLSSHDRANFPIDHLCMYGSRTAMARMQPV
ncbi:hypothetical protein RHMOL_Rhmol04G0159700 [Rhododendron molle]|uniref:Uncharacterized protein n=1 Tax=Rhododendron molle TaxID=49168 RepID=A0ACC0P2A1_RHOML|nr:hypothetical protein RHMOL_Rhmol04G0159700 [Rhododendron molle]